MYKLSHKSAHGTNICPRIIEQGNTLKFGLEYFLMCKCMKCNKS
jgi:hypothetical protein